MCLPAESQQEADILHATTCEGLSLSKNHMRLEADSSPPEFPGQNSSLVGTDHGLVRNAEEVAKPCLDS